MIERVARELAKTEADGDDVYDRLDDKVRAHYRALAHAAIGAMREPTDTIQFVGLIANEGNGRVRDAVPAYQAMIDNALARTA